MKFLKLPQICTCFILTFTLVVSFASGAFGQQDTTSAIPDPPSVTDKTEVYGYPAATIEWKPAGGDTLLVSYESPVSFTGLSVGWDVEAGDFEVDDFELHIRTREAAGQYGEWHVLPGEYAPDENPSGIYWSELYLTPGEEIHTALEIRLVSPISAGVNLLRVSLADTSWPQDQEPPTGGNIQSFQTSSTPSAPTIITRDQWWGSLPLDQLDSPGWLPEAISITHSIVHHPVSQNNPSNPAQAVRSIWHYHAITLGWGDIGYNFLIDQHGNIYQGRYNPWLYITDTRAGHAGFSNLKSVGISLLGQFHPDCSNPAPGEPTAAAIASLEKLIAWRFYQRGLNPLETDGIDTKHYGFIDVPRICGHRDVSKTSCPGDNLYAYMSSIRSHVNTLVKEFQLSCHVFRLAGPNRYQTAVEISQAGWPNGAQTVLLARGDDYADALAGAPLAYQLDAPILLTPSHRLEDIITTEILRLQAANIVILGGSGAISAEVENTLLAMGFAVKRISGQNRYATATLIGQEMMEQGGAFDTVFIAVSTNFADALSASAYAARLGIPIFMTAQATLTEATSAALKSLGIKNTIVVGGTGVVSPEVFNQLPNPKRIYGDNRYATSKALAEEFLPAGKDAIFIATGLDFPDAISGSVLAAKRNSGVLLVQGTGKEPPPVVCDFLSQKKIQSVTLLGGFSVITLDVEAWLKNHLPF